MELDEWWSATGESRLAAYLAAKWDPIFRVLDGLRAPDDEYSDFVPTIRGLLDQGADSEKLAEFLFQAEKDMHLRPDDEDRRITAEVAQAIVDWYGQEAP